MASDSGFASIRHRSPFAHPPVWIPNPGDGYAAILGELLAASRASGNGVPDAHLAALAIEQGLRRGTTDSDFARFNCRNWENPIAPLR